MVGARRRPASAPCDLPVPFDFSRPSLDSSPSPTNVASRGEACHQTRTYALCMAPPRAAVTVRAQRPAARDEAQAPHLIRRRLPIPLPHLPGESAYRADLGRAPSLHPSRALHLERLREQQLVGRARSIAIALVAEHERVSQRRVARARDRRRRARGARLPTRRGQKRILCNKRGTAMRKSRPASASV
eukprot:1342747-Prymnesium_polylepis.1